MSTRFPIRVQQFFSQAVDYWHGSSTAFREWQNPRGSKQLGRVISVVLMVAGAAMLLYVAGQYWTMYSEQRRLASEWQQQNTGREVPAALVNDGLTRISIPKIDLNAVIVEGISHKALLRGPGHLPDTPAPGEPGNSVISAHRDTFFRHIYELNKGDLINVQRNGHSYVYEVTGKKIVDPSDLSVVKPTTDARLTLITCYPTYFIGPAPERLVVFTKLSDESQAQLTNTSVRSDKATPIATH
jgi:LPXTG-site transpeptidase (sortase) family protein